MQRQIVRIAQRRRGWLAPVVALSLVIIMGAVALVLDRLWLDMATTEAQAISEASALAAARELASDDDLRGPQTPPESRIAAATVAAQNVASMNHISGQTYAFDPSAGELTYGVNVTAEDTGETKFIETSHDPRAARIVVQRTRNKGNPVALFLRGITRVPNGEVRAQSEATIDNHIVGFQTVAGSRVPMLPLAILANDPAGRRQDTWKVQIEQRRGTDQYRFDPTTGEVHTGSDGIPEITLTPASVKGAARQTNMAFFDVHGQAGHFPLAEQIKLGLSTDDLERRDGRLVQVSGPELFPARSTVSKTSADALKQIIGQCRGIMLYLDSPTTAGSTSQRIMSAGFAAGRVMAVKEQGGGEVTLVFQPGVLATRTAVRPVDLGMADVDAAANKYLYQMKLTQ